MPIITINGEKYTVSEAFNAGISLNKILWRLYKLKDASVNKKLTRWLKALVKRADDVADADVSSYISVYAALAGASRYNAAALAYATAQAGVFAAADPVAEAEKQRAGLIKSFSGDGK